MKTLLWLLILVLASSLSYGQDRYTNALRSAYKGVLSNLSDPNITPGAVIASPSQNNPNYYYHWVRDAGLTMMEIVELYQLPLTPERKHRLENLIRAWIQFELSNQNIALSRSNLGEPIFTVHGEIYPHPWGRPQNDGPAIRALAMTNYALSLLQQGRPQEVLPLYKAELPPSTPIKRDLEYIASEWQAPSYDLWEEVRGQHFFTRMAQRAALLKGAQLAQLLNDPFAASYYQDIATRIEMEILSHRNNQRGYIVPTLNQTDGWRHKTSELDISVLLGILYFSLNDGFLEVDDPWVAATANKMEETFANLYPINRSINLPPAIGRYPEDVYNGNGFGEGNPWFLATLAYAEYNCRLSKINHPNQNSEQLLQRAFGFLDRIIFHSDPGGRMPEQFNRHNGYTQGARDLTWSYTSYIRTYRKCSNDTHLMDLEELEMFTPALRN